MAEKIKLVQNDTRPNLEMVLTDENTGAAINLTGATVKLNMRKAGETASYKKLTCTLSDPTNGAAYLDWNTDPTALAVAGDYEAEVEITFADARVQTVYDLLKIHVRETF